MMKRWKRVIYWCVQALTKANQINLWRQTHNIKYFLLSPNLTDNYQQFQCFITMSIYRTILFASIHQNHLDIVGLFQRCNLLFCCFIIIQLTTATIAYFLLFLSLKGLYWSLTYHVLNLFKESCSSNPLTIFAWLTSLTWFLSCHNIKPCSTSLISMKYRARVFSVRSFRVVFIVPTLI